MEPRYLLMIFPALFIISSVGLVKIEKIIEKYNKKFIPLAVILLILLFGAYYQINQTKASISSKVTSYKDVKDSGLWLKENTEKDAVIFSQSEPQDSYYAERRIYGFMGPNSNQSYFEEKVEEIRPDYLVISIFEPHAQWAYNFPQEHPELLTPLVGFPVNNPQPSLIIYKFSYEEDEYDSEQKSS